MKILIVGTGLSAYAIYCALKDSGAHSDNDIFVVDVNKRFFFDKSVGLAAAAHKTSFGSTHMYASLNNPEIPESLFNLSYSAGGLSSVWGAGIRLWDKNQISTFVDDVGTFYENAKSLLNHFRYLGTQRELNLPAEYFQEKSSSGLDFNNFGHDEDIFSDDFSYFNTPLAVDLAGSNACRYCGRCLSGCPYGSILDTSVAFDRLLINQEIERIIGQVIRFEQRESKVIVEIKTQEDCVETFNFDRIYLCAGAIGTPKILLQSEILQKAEILDSQVFYFAGIHKAKQIDGKAFALSQKTITDHKTYSASLYTCNEEVRNRISSMLLKRLFHFRVSLPKFLDRILFLGIGFMDSDLSGSSCISLNSEESINVELKNQERPNKSVRIAMRKIRRQLLHLKLFVLPFRMIPPIGSGFHSGGSTYNLSGVLNENGSLIHAPGVFVSDTSALPKIFPGSHTFNSMVYSYTKVKNQFS